MNNPNPFVPQGSLLEQKNKKRARVKLAVFSIFALNLLVITPLLIQGCTKKDNGDQASNNPPADSTPPAPAPDTNPPPALPPVGTNPVPSNTVAEPVPPPQPAPPPVAPTPQAQDYVVTKGDTYYSIAKKFSIKMSDIKNANPTVNPARLKVGQKLQIPAGGSGGTGATADSGAGDVYVVKAGDTLGKIAKANATSIKAIRAMNNLKTDRIKVGDKLKMPMKAAAAAPADMAPVPPPASASTTTAASVPMPAPTPTSGAGH
jgi:LysM repeat protein